jgi:hypothetical protein
MWIVVAWLVVALIHTPPALAAFSPRLRASMYGVAETPALGVILTHRGVLFLAVAVACVFAAFNTEARQLATIVAGVSVFGFLIVYAAAGSPKGSLRTIALMDVIAAIALVFTALDAWA